MERMETSSPLFLGLDSSTQGLKAVVFDLCNKEAKSYHVHYDTDFPQYSLTSGVVKNGSVVTQPSLMYFEALDLLFERMMVDNFPFSKIRAISGAGQQHGSVFWKQGTKDILNRKVRSGEGLLETGSLKSILKDCFSVDQSPIWMDNSTSEYCRFLESKIVDHLVGDEKEEFHSMNAESHSYDSQIDGARIFKRITGSRATERFTCAQILKFAFPKLGLFSGSGTISNEDMEISCAYLECERISLISSALPSVLLGDYAPIDYSDASGMNLMCIHKRCWSPSIINLLKYYCPDLENKLGAPVSALERIGYIGQYFVKKYGFSPSTEIYPWMGDNPSSLIGVLSYQTISRCISRDVSACTLSIAGTTHSSPSDEQSPIHIGDSKDKDETHINTIVSLGTSDTIFRVECEPSEDLSTNTFLNPLFEEEVFSKEPFINLICIRNGGVSRDLACSHFIEGNWDNLNSSLSSFKRDNTFAFQLFAIHDEINPPIPNGGYSFAINLDPPSVRRVAIERPINVITHFTNNPTTIASTETATEHPRNSSKANGTAMTSMLTSQFLLFRRFLPSIKNREHGKLIVTGGASKNQALLQLLANVLGYDIHNSSIPNSAALGGAVVAFLAYIKNNLQGISEYRGLDAVDAAKGPRTYNLAPFALASTIEKEDHKKESSDSFQHLAPMLVAKADPNVVTYFSNLEKQIEEVIKSISVQ